MAVCDFCKKKIKPGTGKVFVKNTGKVLHFCSQKCQKKMIKFKKRAGSEKWVEK